MMRRNLRGGFGDHHDEDEEDDDINGGW